MKFLNLISAAALSLILTPLAFAHVDTPVMESDESAVENKSRYRYGTVESLDLENRTLTILEKNSGKLKRFSFEEGAKLSFEDGASKRLSHLRKGDDVALKIATK